MKSAPFPVGNIKCRGKRTKTLACGCCVMFNAKWELRLEQAKREINRFMKECR